MALISVRLYYSAH